MAVQYLSDTLQQLYNGTAGNSAATSTQLSTFRTGGDIALDNDITALDQRIQSFESVLIGNIAAGQASADYPYDRAGLKREFLDEAVGLLLRRSVGTGAVAYAASGVLITSNPSTTVGNISLPDPLFKGGAQTDIAKTGTTGTGVFDELNASAATNDTDPRLAMLTPDGQAIFKSYANLIDQVFAEGDKLGNNPAQPVEVASATTPLTIDGVTYDRIAQVTGLKTVPNTNPPQTVPSFQNYLLQSTAADSKVIKDTAGNDVLTGPASSTATRILLDPQAASLDQTTHEYTVTVDSLAFGITVTATGVQVRTGTSPATPATQISPLLLNLPSDENAFPASHITVSYTYKASNGTTYLVGFGTDGKAYVTSLGAANTQTVGTTANLTGMEYLLYYNEARTKILRAQLAYKEAVVREIQDDLKKANDTLAELETQSGAITAQDKDGQPTGQYSADTLTMSVFNAEASSSGNSILARVNNDSLQNATDWQTSRTNLKNYIDKRSSEAQQATLDYQNTLNRFNNALDVMAKLQEKLDTLLKGQLHNFA